MTQYILYIFMGIIILIIVFLLLRIILQMIFIKECPKCGKTVSLAKSKICPRCDYDFNERRDPKFHGTVAVLVICILGLGAFDVYSFQNRTKAYDASNPYISVKNITKEAQDAEETISTETVTEVPVEGSTEGQMPEGQTAEGQTPEGQTPEGQTPEGQNSEGQTPEGQTAEGQTSEGQTPEGQNPEEQTPEGQNSEGQASEWEGNSPENQEGVSQ